MEGLYKLDAEIRDDDAVVGSAGEEGRAGTWIGGMLPRLYNVSSVLMKSLTPFGLLMEFASRAN
jgi:hypothetical protein